MAILKEICMASADMQWPFYSGERIMAHKPLVVFFHPKCISEFFTTTNDPYILWTLIRCTLAISVLMSTHSICFH